MLEYAHAMSVCKSGTLDLENAILDDALFEATAAGSGEVFAITVAQCQRVQCVQL